MSLLACADHVFAGCAQVSVRDVIENAVVEQNAILRDYADLLPKAAQGHPADILSVYSDFARRWIKEAK